MAPHKGMPFPLHPLCSFHLLTPLNPSVLRVVVPIDTLCLVYLVMLVYRLREVSVAHSAMDLF